MNSPWESSGPDPVVRRLAAQPPVVVDRPRSVLRDPARMVAALGALLAIVSSPLPWLTRVGNPPPEVRTGWSSTADGFLLAVVGVGLLALALSRGAASARSRGLRLLPAGLGALAAILGIGAQRTMENQIAIWQGEGATGVYEPWFYVSLAGAVLAAVGGLWLGIRRGLAPSAPRDPTDVVRVSNRGIASGAVGALGVVVGVAVAAVTVLNSGLDDVAMSMPLLFGILAGGLFGGYVGSRFGAMLVTEENPLARPRDEEVRLEKVRPAGGVSRRDRRDPPDPSATDERST